jgi:hypothetical protein
MSINVNRSNQSFIEWDQSESIQEKPAEQPAQIEQIEQTKPIEQIEQTKQKIDSPQRINRSVSWGSLSRSLAGTRESIGSIGSIESPLDLEQLRRVAMEFTESQQNADAILATSEGRAQFEEIRKRILLDQEEEIFGPQGQFPGWEAKQRLIFLEPGRVEAIRMAGDGDIIRQLPGTKLSHLITDLAGSEDTEAAARSQQAREQLSDLSMRLVQNQQSADQILSTEDGAISVDALRYMVMNRQEELVLGSMSSAFGWEAKMRLIFFKPREVERIRMLNDQVAIDEFDQVKLTRALNEGGQIVSLPRPSQSNRSQLFEEFMDLIFSTPGKKVGIYGTKVRDGRGIDDLRRNQFPQEYTQREDGSFELKSAALAAHPLGGQFDPYQFLPNIAFHNSEDAFPIDPSFDGDGWPDNNAINYAHGSIGGKQPLNSAVNVFEKDGYYVVQYGFYYADNKGGDYHKHDWNTTSVYLKYNQATGNFEPQYLYNSWHFGGVMTRWSDLKLDSQGRPTVLIGLGTHAARPLGRGQSLPSDYANGLTLRGSDGQAVETSTNRSTGERLSFFTTQSNVGNATFFDSNGTTVERTRAGIYYWWQDHRRNPYPPKLFGMQ